jgi:hypothetical protein
MSQYQADNHRREYPNYPEVSGSTLPLLATVLAGFAVTIIVQIALAPGTSNDLPRRMLVGLAGFLLSTVLLLSSAVFAINAQANNYLPFLDISERSAHWMQVSDTGAWLHAMERRWRTYHVATLLTFYAGVVLVLISIGLTIWHYVGAPLAIAFTFATVAGLLANIAVGIHANRDDSSSAVGSGR